MQKQYEEAIRETFAYLDECMASMSKRKSIEYLYSLGIDKTYVIERQMELRGFKVSAEFSQYKPQDIIVYPSDNRLPIHIWSDKNVY